jgi:hypothetical protein
LAAALYAILSLVCLVAPYSPVLSAIVRPFGSWFWVLGPPVLLLHGRESLPVYFVGTVVIAIGVLLIGYLSKRPGELAIAVALILAVVWFGFGAFMYIVAW